MNGRSILYLRGWVLGGSSSINAMLYLRGQAQDYDRWAQLTGDSDWAWQNVLPVFMRLEDHWFGGDEKHVAGGEWRVESSKLRWEILEAFRDAAEEAGIPKIDDFNRGDNEGVDRFEVNQRSEVQWCGQGVSTADDAGVAVIPHEKAALVLEAARKIDAGDSKRKADIDAGASVADPSTKKYK